MYQVVKMKNGPCSHVPTYTYPVYIHVYTTFFLPIFAILGGGKVVEYIYYWWEQWEHGNRERKRLYF
jgi:hypothetical protein